MTVLLSLICLALVAALVWERREHQKVQNALMTRVQAPQLAPMLAPVVSPEDEPQFVDETEQERIWAEANGTDFVNSMEGMNGGS